MKNKLYVGNLSNDVTDEDLKYNFGELGTCVSAKIIRDKHSGLSRGFAFVEIVDDESAQKAIDALHEHVADGRPLNVNQAKPKENRQRRDRW